MFFSSLGCSFAFCVFFSLVGKFNVVFLHLPVFPHALNGTIHLEFNCLGLVAAVSLPGMGPVLVCAFAMQVGVAQQIDHG